MSLLFRPARRHQCGADGGAHWGGRQAWVLRGLLDAVIAAPQINFPEALLALAKRWPGKHEPPKM
ncbi:MAG: hypothetical protein V8T36_06140 [Ruthenibacterium lactatiformans]